MNKKVILEYVKKITKDDIFNYGIKNNIVLTKDELNIIYGYIKNDIVRIIDDPLDIIKEIKDKVNDNTYNKIVELYDKYKILLKK